MLTVKTDDGKIYQFTRSEYTDYDLTESYFVVKRRDQWIGIFSRDHLISVVVDINN